MRYTVESLEPRYLLSGTPVDLTDHTKAQATNAADGTKVAAELTSLIGKLSYLGQQLDKDTISNPITQSVIPLLNQTVADLTKGNTGGFTLGNMLFSNSTVANSLISKINSDFAAKTGTGSTSNVTSALLAADLQTILQADYGSGFTVTDNSTAGGELDLHFSYTSTASLNPDIVLGNAAQEFNLKLVQTSTGGPDTTAKMTTTTTVSFDIMADFSTSPSDNNSVVKQLATYDAISNPTPTQTQALQSQLDSDFTFNPGTIEETALISQEGGVSAGGYLPQFGVQFGVMGAGENDANAKIDGAYASNATFDLDVDAKIQFGSSSYTLATLTTNENAATTNNPYTPYTFVTPVGNTVSGSQALTNEATLTLPIQVYNDGQVGSATPGNASSDPTFISGLGNVTGTFTIKDANLFDGSTPLVSADSVELASFARLDASSIVAMAQNSSYLAGEIDNQLSADLPFLNLTQGEAYDFATALQNAFVNAMQTTSIVLTATNEPSTIDTAFPSGDPSNLTGSTSFKINLVYGTGSSAHAYLLNVTLAANGSRTTMDALVTDLNTAIKAALSANSLSTTNPKIFAQLQTNSAGVQTIQLVSTDPTAQFFLYNFATPATGSIDLGFNQYNNVVAQSSTGITSTSPSAFQVPGVIVQSSTPLSIGDFSTTTSFNVSVNGGSAVTVTIPGQQYADSTALLAAIQHALQVTNPQLWDGVSQDGVMVQIVQVGNGVGLEFYGGNDVHSLSFSSAGSNSNFAALKLTTTSSTATSFKVSVTQGGVTTNTTVYLNGNLTNGLLNFEQANQSASDLVSDIQRALIQAGVLNSAQTAGVTVAAAADSTGAVYIQFIAANPGTGSGQISSFNINTIGSALSGILGTTTISSQNISLAASSTKPAFQTVQQLAALLYNLHFDGTNNLNSDNYYGILAAAPSYSVGDLTSPTGSPSFTFPIDITVNDTSTLNGSQILPDLTGVGLNFGSTYDDVSNISSDSTVSVKRSDNLSFAFGFNLIAPANPTEQLTAAIPVTQLFTDYFLNTQGILQVMVDTGVTYTLTIPPSAANADTSLTTFLAALNAAIATATPDMSGAPALSTYLQAITSTTDDTGEVSILFTSKAGTTRELTVTIPPETASDSTVNDAAWNDLGFLPNTTQTTPYTQQSDSSGGAITAKFDVGTHANGTDLAATSTTAENPYVLTTTGFITFHLPDGTTGTLEIDPADTAADTSLQDLVNVINHDILSTAALKGSSYLLTSGDPNGAYNVLPKVKADIGADGKSIEFSLNSDVFGPGPYTQWSLTVSPTYLQANPNSLAQDIGMPTQTVVDSVQSALGMLSGAILPGSFPMSGTDSFEVSIDGQNYVDVSVNLAGVTTIGGLVKAINAGIAAAPNVSFAGISGSFALSDYLTAQVTNGGTQILIRLKDGGVVNDYGSSGTNVSAFPVLENAAIKLDSASGKLSGLGFSSQELFFTLKGSEGTIKSVSWTGTATQVNSPSDTGAAFNGTAAFGFTTFNIGHGLLDESAITNVTFSPVAGSTINSLLADANVGDFTTHFGGITQAPNSSSYAVVTLGQLSFPTSSTITGLSFGANASIELGYGTFGTFTGPTISSFDSLPPAVNVVYTNTNNMQLLSRLDLASIVHGLERVGDMLSDWMQNGTGPFDSKLFFTLQSLVGIDNFGQDFANAVAGVLLAPPSSLESTPAALIQALQLDPSAMAFTIQSTGSGSTAQVVLNISFDWAQTIIETLPLAVDLASLANNASTDSTYIGTDGQTKFYSSGVINQFLLGLSTISSDPVNPININFSEVSQLAVNLDLIAATNGVAIQPQAVIKNPASGNFFQTNYLLDGDNLTGNLPAGAGYLQLDNGFFAINATGDLDGATSVLTTSTTNLNYSSATNTITGTGAINGYTIVSADVGSYVLINGQTTAAQNGLYQVSGYDATTSTWTLTQEVAVGSVGAAPRFHVENGNAANQFLGLATGAATQFTIQAPRIYDTLAASQVSPTTLSVLAVSTAPFTATKGSNTLTGTGKLTLDGYQLSSSDVGGYVLVNSQTDTTQNGLYTVTAVGANSWTLTRSTAATSQTRLQMAHGTLYSGKFFGYDTPTQFALLIEPATYSYNLAASETLPYTVQAATTGDLGSSVTFSPGASGIPATLTGTAGVSINNQATTAVEGTSTLHFSGIDNVHSLKVGSLVLVKDQTAENQNGVYVVTALGGADANGNPTSWVLTRADFADSLSELSSVRVDVATGYENVGTRWVQNSPTLSVLDSSNITFSNTVTSIYSTTTSNGGPAITTPWLTFTAVGQGVANLPLNIVAVTSNGQQIIIGHDLQNAQQQVTIDDLKAFYASLGTINGTDITLDNLVVSAADSVHGALLYKDFAAFQPLMFNFSLPTYFNAGGSNAVHFSYVPDLYDSFVSPSIISAFQNAFYIGDALDLALFTIQSSIAEALAQEFPLVGTSLAGEAEFVENFRSQFTSLVRQNILNNPNFPLQDIRDAIYSVAFNEGLLANFTLADGTPIQSVIDINSIEVDVIVGGVATAFPFGDYTNTTYYGKNSNGTLYEQVPAGATAITFAFKLDEEYSSAYTTTLNTIDLGDSSIGATVSSSTEDYNTGATTSGGINLQRKFVFNFGFGIDVNAGFFVYNPTQVAGSGLQSQPMVDFGFKAELDGNINNGVGTVDPFYQNTYVSDVNGLAVEVSDGRIIDQLNNPTEVLNDNLPSGFYGDVLFDLNFNHPSSDPNATTVGFLNGRYANVEDLRAMDELGPDSTGNTPANSIFHFVINADADIDLQLQSQQQGLQPAIQADFIYDKTYGAGAIGFGLIWNNPAIIGLGDVGLGTREISDQSTASLQSSQDDFTSIATQVSPIWRFADRDTSSSLLLANGAEGNSFVDYQNIKINIIDYLGNVLYSALKVYEEIVSPLRPYITFLTTPIPGTTAFTSSGITVGTLLGSKFQTFISDIQAIDNLISPLSSLAAEDTGGSGWVAAPATAIDLSGLFSAAEYLGGKVADKVGEKIKEKYDQYQKKKAQAENTAETSSENQGVEEDTSSSASQKRAQQAISDVEDTSDSSDSTSSSFNKFKTGNSSSGQGASNKTEDTSEKDGETQKGEGKKGKFSAGLTGGNILLDALDYNTLTNILNGVDANLLRVQLPSLNVSYTYTKEIPVDVFPPLVITLGFTIGFDVNINFGWDTKGFFFNTVDLTSGDPLPLFDFTGKFSVGIGLDFGLINVEADVFFQATVSFFWNDVSGTGKLHMSDLQYLTSHNDSIFAVEVKGEVGFDFDIVLSIPIPLVGPINITIFSYTYSITLFDVTFGAVTGQMQLGTVMTGADGQQDVLVLNSGIYASQRLFINTDPVNEHFVLYDVGGNATTGENILVEFDGQYYQEFDGIKQVIGYTGRGSSSIDAGASLSVGSGLQVTLITTGNDPTTKTYTSDLKPLQYAVVDFFGGAGDTILRAGAGYNAAWGRSRLQGGIGTGTELLEANVTLPGVTDPGVDIIAGGGPAIIYDSAGSDNVVLGQGPDLVHGGANDHFYFESGFGNDRIYVTGGGNSVSFGGWTLNTQSTGTASTIGSTTTVIDSILTSAEISQFITQLNVAAITTPLTLSFGPLVQSAVTGNSTVFFATDPSETQQIDSWTGGVGGDIYNIYYFAPDQTLTLNAPVQSNKVNTFNVYLGNPNIVYKDVPAENKGTINLNDTNNQDVLNILQTFPETVNSVAGATGYSAAYSNGRELLNYDNNLLVNYNAPNSTIILGDPSYGNTFDPIKVGTYNVGTIVLVSPIEFVSPNVVLKVKNTLDLLYSINMVGTSTTPASLEIDITNAFPTGESDLTFENGAVLSISKTSQVGNATSPADGYGLITLNLNSGSLKDVNGTTGTISVINGMLVISALTSIGAPNDIFNIIAGQLVARTTSLNNVSGNNGIYIKSPSNLSITAFGDMNGLSTAAGDIYIDIENGNTLSYYLINAGSGGAGGLGGNVTIVADHIVPIDSFSVTRNVLTQEPIIEQIVTIVPVINVTYLQIALFFGGSTFFALEPFFLTYSVQVTDQVIGYQLVSVPTQVTVGGLGSDAIVGTGTLSFWNDLAGSNITVGDQTTAPTSGLYLTTELLNTIATGFASIVIGRSSTDPKSTGNVTVNPLVFNQASNVTFQGSSIDVVGSVTNDHATSLGAPDGQLQFKSYGTSGTAGAFDGHLKFSSSGTITADTINISASADLHLDGSFLARDAAPSGHLALQNGAIQIASTGNVTLDAGSVVNATVGLSNVSITAGTLSSPGNISINSTALVEASKFLTLTAVGGMISDSAHPANRAKANTLILQAATGINLDVDVLTISSATTSAGNLILNNNDVDQLAGGALSVDALTATTGSISLTNQGDINLVRGNLVSTPLIKTGTASGESVTLTSTAGAISGDTAYETSEYDIQTASLSLSAANAISGSVISTLQGGTKFHALITNVGSLAATSTTGAVSIANVGSVVLTDVETHAQPITIYGTNDISVQGTVSTNNSGVGSSPTGSILIDNHILASNGGSILLGVAAASPNPGVQGTIDAGNAGVTLTADNSILGATGFNLVGGSAVSLTAWGDKVSNSATDTLISVKLATATVDAFANKPGKIVLDTNQNLLLHDVETFAGDINVTAESATVGGPGVNLVTYDVNAGSSNVYLTADGTITDDTTDTGLTNDITAATLTAMSVGDTILKTDISDLFATVGGTGSLTVNQGGSFDVDSAVTNNGFITINAGQNSAVGHLSDGSIFVGTITAGNSSAINLNTLGGHVEDVNFGTVGDTSLVTGGTLTATTQYGIHGLNTAISQLDATSAGIGAFITIAQTGDILIDNVDMTAGGDMTLTAKAGSTPGTITVKNITTDTVNSTVSLTSIGSAIEQQVGKIIAATLNLTAETEITALTKINYLNATITGASGDITITQDKDVEIGQVQTPQGAFDLTLLSGGVTASNQPLALPYNIEANTINIDTFTGIATSAQNLNVYADALDATASVSGGIFVHNYKTHTGTDAFVADHITTPNGPVSIASAGNLLARDIEIQADQAGNDITLLTTDGGDVLINFVGTGLADAVIGVTPPNFGDLIVTSAGLINAVDPTLALEKYHGNPVNIVAHGITFDAQTGIGTPPNLSPIITGKLLGATTKTGDINSGDSSSGDFFISNFSTGMGNLSFIKGGGGNLYATGFSTKDGNVTLTVHDAGTLFLGTVFAIGNVSLQMDHVFFQGGTGSVYGTGILNIQPDNPMQYVQINSIFAQTPFERPDTLEIGRIGFDAFFTGFQQIVIGNYVSNITYVYDNFIDEQILLNGDISGTTIFLDEIQNTPATPAEEFRLASLFAKAVAEAEAEGQFTEADIQAIVNELGDTGDLDNSSYDDSTEDFFFASTGSDASNPAFVQSNPDSGKGTVPPAPAALTGAMPHQETASVEEDSSWIDRAAVVTTAVVAATKPLRRFLGLF